MSYKFLLPYQKRALKEMERNKYSILMWARQTGKSFTVSLFAVLRALKRDRHLVAVISPTERQSKELMEKVRNHITLLKAVGRKIGEYSFFEDTKSSTLEVRFPNGSRILGLPANPDGTRGLTGDVILEECAFFQDGMKVYQAIFPSITRNKDFKLIAISTPKSKKDLFYYLWELAKEEGWFRDKLTIYDAIRQGLEVNVEELKKAIPNDIIWRQEYLCEFLEEEETFLPLEMITQCEEEGVLRPLEECKGPLYAGVDIGRRKDLTVISVLEKDGSLLYLRDLRVLEKLPFREQFEIIYEIAKRCEKTAIDETGMGMPLAEELERYFPNKVERVYFSAKTKEELANRLRSKFQDRLIRIPPDPKLRQDLNSVSITTTKSGNLRIEGSSEDSHADRFWSLALAVYASSKKESIFRFLKLRWL